LFYPLAITDPQVASPSVEGRDGPWPLGGLGLASQVACCRRRGDSLDVMAERVTVERRSARAIVIDDEGRLVLIKRSKPDREPYWTTAGGGVEDGDASIEAAMHRELLEELGAEAIGASQVFLASFRSATGLHVRHFFVARLVGLDPALRTGPEFTDPARGAYDPYRVDLRGDELEGVDLRPPKLKEFILANREALLAEVGLAM
jgi:ADP-ribose pyrophosphatase YjhB (NUDIX family)